MLCARMSAPDKVSITHLFSKLPSERAYWHSVRLMLLKLPLSLSVFTDAAFTSNALKMLLKAMWSRPLGFVELIFTSGTYKVCHKFIKFVIAFFYHKLAVIMHSTIRWLTLNQFRFEHIRLNTATESFWHFQCVRLSCFVFAWALEATPSSENDQELQLICI